MVSVTSGPEKWHSNADDCNFAQTCWLYINIPAIVTNPTKHIQRLHAVTFHLCVPHINHSANLQTPRCHLGIYIKISSSYGRSSSYVWLRRISSTFDLSCLGIETPCFDWGLLGCRPLGGDMHWLYSSSSSRPPTTNLVYLLPKLLHVAIYKPQRQHRS